MTHPRPDTETRGTPSTPSVGLASPRDPASVAIAAALTVVLSVALGVLLAATEDWAHDSRPATCLETRCFCEAIHTGSVAQPANTVSSLVYLALGAWALTRFIRGPRPSAEASIGSSRLLIPGAAVATCVVGLSSAYYHATLTFLGQYLDVMSMYLLGALLVSGALWRRGSVSERSAGALFLAMVALLGIAQYVEPELRRVLFAAVLVPGIVLEHSARVHGVTPADRRLWPLRSAVLLLVLGYASWLLDQGNVLCWPDSVFQGHAAWHTLTAIAAVLLVSHYARTPRPKESMPGPGR